VSVRGDFKKLDRLVRFLGRMPQPEFKKGLVRAVVEAARGEVDESFSTAKDPWDRRWKPSRRAVAQSGQTLTDTARLRRSFSYALQADGFTLGTNVKYAGIHQYGGTIRPKGKKALRFKLGKEFVTVKVVRLPARPFIPEPELSPRWERAFAEAISAYLEGAAP
jgi:phage gpG-like protein